MVGGGQHTGVCGLLAFRSGVGWLIAYGRVFPRCHFVRDAKLVKNVCYAYLVDSYQRVAGEYGVECFLLQLVGPQVLQLGLKQGNETWLG